MSAEQRTRVRVLPAVAVLAAVVVLFVIQARVVGAVFGAPDEALAAHLAVRVEPPRAAIGPATVANGTGTTSTDVSTQPTTPGSDALVASAASAASTLTPWANDLSPQVGIPPVALAAYGAAQLALSASDPACHLSWPTLAGIGYVESDHGRYAGSQLGADGRSEPPIIGIALDGGVGIARVSDTDDGRLDGDTALDRAVGPMQFLPGTWARWAVDADGDGRSDPFDIDDAALAAGHYLCAAGGDLTTGTGWSAAVYAYNASDDYVITVRDTADWYAAASQQARS